MYDYITKIISQSNKHKLLFIHVAKCGGVSITKSLRYKYLLSYTGLNSGASLMAAVDAADPYEDYYQSVLTYRDLLLKYFMNTRSRFISGHFAYNDWIDDYLNKFIVMTVLREPIERFVSSYYYNKNKNENSPWKVNCSLSEFCETKQGIFTGMDYGIMFSGIKDSAILNQDIVINNAINNLNKIHICERIEDVDRIKESILEHANIKVKIKKLNVNKNRKKITDIDEYTLDKIKNVCLVNTRIYNEMFESGRK